MDDKTIHAGVSILLALIGVAVLAVLVSKSSNTSGVTSATGSAFDQILCVALSPITGKTCRNLVESVTSTITF